MRRRPFKVRVGGSSWSTMEDSESRMMKTEGIIDARKVLGKLKDIFGGVEDNDIISIGPKGEQRQWLGIR
jgi:hypothetical protein